MDIDDAKPPTPDGAQSPLFEPDGPAPSLFNSYVPVAVMVVLAPVVASSLLDQNVPAADMVPETSDLSSLLVDQEQHHGTTSSSIQVLRDIEAAA
jgi:hypothetical protein